MEARTTTYGETAILLARQSMQENNQMTKDDLRAEPCCTVTSLMPGISISVGHSFSLDLRSHRVFNVEISLSFVLGYEVAYLMHVFLAYCRTVCFFGSYLTGPQCR